MSVLVLYSSSTDADPIYLKYRDQLIRLIPDAPESLLELSRIYHRLVFLNDISFEPFAQRKVSLLDKSNKEVLDWSGNVRRIFGSQVTGDDDGRKVSFFSSCLIVFIAKLYLLLSNSPSGASSRTRITKPSFSRNSCETLIIPSKSRFLRRCKQSSTRDRIRPQQIGIESRAGVPSSIEVMVKIVRPFALS